MSKKLIIALIAIVCLVIAVYYFIPGYNHYLISSSDNPTGTHVKHVGLFLALAIVDIIFGRILLNSSSPKTEKQPE